MRDSGKPVVTRVNGEAVVVVTFDAEDARSIAYALGPHDGAYSELMEAADEADRMNE